MSYDKGSACDPEMIELQKQATLEEYERKHAEWKAKDLPRKSKRKYPSNYTPPKKKRR